MGSDGYSLPTPTPRSSSSLARLCRPCAITYFETSPTTKTQKNKTHFHFYRPTILDLRGCSRLTGTCLRPVRACMSLAHVDIRGTQLLGDVPGLLSSLSPIETVAATRRTAKLKFKHVDTRLVILAPSCNQPNVALERGLSRSTGATVCHIEIRRVCN